MEDSHGNRFMDFQNFSHSWIAKIAPIYGNVVCTSVLDTYFLKYFTLNFVVYS